MAIKNKLEETAEMEKKENVENSINKQKTEEIVKIAYIGPTLPSGQLKCNKVFVGTEIEIKKELKPILDKYPLVEKMLVPINQIGKKKEKIKVAGNIMHKYYTDLVSYIAGTVMITKEEK